ncbi:MAG: hypothetical protein ACLT40_06535 [Fusobacterium sp.]
MLVLLDDKTIEEVSKINDQNGVVFLTSSIEKLDMYKQLFNKSNITYFSPKKDSDLFDSIEF